MKKIIRLNEKDLERIIRRIIKEEDSDFNWANEITVPGFTPKELEEIESTVLRLLSPGFYEDYEVESYLDSVSNKNPETEKSLIQWLKSRGVNFYQPKYRNI